ncbi:MAG: sigma-70 family RNA polymerase sigma factor [Candidatus Omnitrophota bacterium]
MNNIELINGCVDKDPVARDAFIKQYLPVIYGSIRNATRSHFVKFGKRASFDEYDDIVEEISHDVVIALFDNDCKVLKVFEGKDGCPLGGYVGTIAIRKAIDYWRRIKNVDSIQEEEESEWGPSKKMVDAQTDPNAEKAFEGFINKESISILLNALDAAERKLCDQIFFQEQEPAVIAQSLNISIDNFYMRKKRLLEKLRDIAGRKNIC